MCLPWWQFCYTEIALKINICIVVHTVSQYMALYHIVAPISWYVSDCKIYANTHQYLPWTSMWVWEVLSLHTTGLVNCPEWTRLPPTPTQWLLGLAQFSHQPWTRLSGIRVSWCWWVATMQYIPVVKYCPLDFIALKTIAFTEWF